ncbi:MAG: hypothetical protein WBA91_08740 [Paracoccaceae bacterium]
MLIGFFLRRIITVALCSGTFWLGVKTDQFFASGRTAGGDCLQTDEVGQSGS